MDVNKRVRYLRKEILHLTQQEFSEKISISRSNMGNIEIGRIALTDRVITDICEKFNVNEKWLKTGEGDPLSPLTRDETISKFAGGLIKESDDSFKKQLVEVLAELDESEWETLEGIARKLAQKD